jgi:MtN3 and saliva related transmembrane protein
MGNNSWNWDIDIGFFAGLLTTGAFLPQVYAVYKSKSNKSLTLVTILVYLLGQVLWLYHGYQEKDPDLLVYATIVGLCYLYLLYAYINFKHK